VFEKDGVKFLSGRSISYLESLENISPELIKELSENETNGWSMFLLHRSMAEIKADINKHLICPVNVEGIKKLIKDEIAKQPKIVWTKAKKIMAVILAILLGVTTIINFLISIEKLTG